MTEKSLAALLASAICDLPSPEETLRIEARNQVARGIGKKAAAALRQRGQVAKAEKGAKTRQAVYSLAADGLSDDEIAQRLGMKAVYVHRIRAGLRTSGDAT